MFSANLKSYSKINIGLRILSKRKDGYHDLETIFYPVKLHDDVFIMIEPNPEKTNSVILKSNKSFIPLNIENLCCKAVVKFFTCFKIAEFYKITIDLKKMIPVGGGLGGGSSDAATVVKFLVKYFKIDVGINKNKIIELALSLGSDVPFFLVMKPCYAFGRGEKMSVLNDFGLIYDILIVNPNLHISTKWAFEKINLNPELEKKSVLKEIKQFDLNRKDDFVNDFEEIVFSKYRILKEIKDELLFKGSVYSSMSGSGATMYGFFEKSKKHELIKCRDDFSEKKYFTFISD